MVSHIKTPFLITQFNDGAGINYDIKIIHNDCLFFNFLIQTCRIHWRKELESELPKMNQGFQDEYLRDHKFAIDGPLLSAHEIREQKQVLINRILAIGYLLYTPKDRARAWAVVPVDMDYDSPKHRGGTGKSLVFNYAFKRFNQQIFQMPASYYGNDPHVFHSLTTGFDIILIDDAKTGFKPVSLFEAITGDILVNPRGKAPFTIPFEKSPKIVLIPDHQLPTDPSVDRRILYTLFSDYYHVQYDDAGQLISRRNPVDDFGKNLFEDFDLNETGHFYQTMEGCLNFYMLRPEKINPPRLIGPENVDDAIDALRGAVETFEKPMQIPFKQWQKTYPDALKFTVTSKKYITIAAAREMLYGENFKDAALLVSKQVGDTYTFIFSEQALKETIS